jgi:hypothetical protein
MASVQRKIVHKQFNSPIALYSDTNIKATLDRELKSLGNGVVGIDFADPTTTRTGNLAKSAVLAALEEEENAQSGGAKPGLKRVAWPPPLESSHYTEPVEYQQQQQPQWQPISQQQSQQPAQQQQQVPIAHVGVVHSPIQNIKPSFQQPQQQQPKSPTPKLIQRPVSIHGFSSFENQVQPQPLSPLPMIQTNFPQQNQASPSISYGAGNSPRGWFHVAPSKSPSGVAVYQRPFYNQSAAPPAPFEMVPPAPAVVYVQANVAQQISPPQPQYQQPYQNQQQQQQQQYQQQPPFMGTPLRKEAPITQKPAPVYQSQPVATSFQGGANKKGDTKWPPENCKQQSEIDNEARRMIALGPAFRPKRVNRVIRSFHH